MALTTILPSGLNSANDFSSLVPAAYTQANNAASFANGAFTKANTDVTNISISTGVYGGASVAPVITVAANGRIIAVSNVSISGGGGGGGASVTVGPTAPSPAANGYLWYDDTSTGELFVYSSNSWVSTSIMPATNVNDPAITGPTQANEATTQTYTISNYNGVFAYIIGVTAGSVTRTAQSIYWTMPSVTTNTTHYMTTQVVSGGVTSAVDTRTVLVVNLNVDDTSIIVTDFSFNNLNSGWVI